MPRSALDAPAAPPSAPAARAPAPSSATLRAPAPSAPASGEDQALRALAESTRTPAVNLRTAVIELERVDVVPREVAEALLILPVVVRDDRIVLAMADPSNRRVIEEVEFASGMTVQPRVAPRERLAKTIAAVYVAKARGDHRWMGPDAEEPPSGVR